MEVQERVEMVCVSPSTGPSDGGQVVTVTGTNLNIAPIACVFGEKRATAYGVTLSHVLCSSPRNEAGDVRCVAVLVDAWDEVRETMQQAGAMDAGVGGQTAIAHQRT